MCCNLHVYFHRIKHVHYPGLRRICRESYNDPAEVYDRLKRLGMCIVAITDHDSIDAAEVSAGTRIFF